MRPLPDSPEAAGYQHIYLTAAEFPRRVSRPRRTDWGQVATWLTEHPGQSITIKEVHPTTINWLKTHGCAAFDTMSGTLYFRGQRLRGTDTKRRLDVELFYLPPNWTEEDWDRRSEMERTGESVL